MKKKLTLEIPIEMHNELKILSIKHNITLTHYIKRLLVEQIYKEHKYDE